MKQNAIYKLKIVAGLHKDAELFIDEGIMYTIGSGDNCDIILMDSGVKEKHLSFVLSQGKIRVESTGPDLLVDGKQAPFPSFELREYQIVGVGDAHLAIGPATALWPVVPPPRQIEVEKSAPPVCLDLVPVDPEPKLPATVPKPSTFQILWGSFSNWISGTDKKILMAASTFVLALCFFIIDAWFTNPSQTKVVYNSAAKTAEAAARPAQKKSMLLSALDSLLNIQKSTMVGTGLVEPRVPVEAQKTNSVDDPVQQIRTVLKKTWGDDNLVETSTGKNDIDIKGYDENNRQNLALSLKENDQGEIAVQGITGTPRMKKDILSQMGDMIRIRVDVSEDMVNVCQRVLKKKGIRKGKVHYAMEDNALTLEGQTKDRKTIASVREIVAKTFPKIDINNKIKLSSTPMAKIDITGVSTGGAPHVILKDGSKVFQGGKLDNGCTIVDIHNAYVSLTCNGKKQKHRL